LHLAVAPLASVLPAAGLEAVAAGGAAAGAAAGADTGADAAAGEAAEAAGVFGDFWTPPWLLHAPFPVAVEVVPSAHVVGAAESAARAGNADANAITAAASSPMRFIFFMNAIVNRFAPFRPQCALGRGNIVVTFIRNGVCWLEDPA
jgi:hypothetical protein